MNPNCEALERERERLNLNKAKQNGTRRNEQTNRMVRWQIGADVVVTKKRRKRERESGGGRDKEINLVEACDRRGEHLFGGGLK